MDVSRAIAGRRSVRLGFGTAGDRTDEILRALGELAARGRPRHRREAHYLRGRTLAGMNAILRLEPAAAATRANRCPSQRDSR